MYKTLLSIPALCLLLAGAGCRSDRAPEPSTGQPALAAKQPLVLISNIDYLRLRDKPGPDGQVIANFMEGDTLYDLGEVSAFTTEVTLRGIRFDEPWLKVRARDSLAGWIYAGGVHFRLDDRAELTNRLMKMRLQTFFGEALAQRVLGYRQTYLKARTSEELAEVYRSARFLRDTLMQVFDKRITIIQGPDQIPNLTWMEEALPGLVAQRVAEGTAFHLFLDYHQWLSKARQTKGPEDNQFVDACLTAYGLDSVEYILPDWTIAVSDEHVFSELGKGVHRAMFSKMTQAMASSRLFEPEYMAFKKQLMDDIMGLQLSYWNNQEAILQELDGILADNPGILTGVDKENIKKRREQFTQPEKNNIRLNHRSGLN
jgi:hypothetical protein